MAVNKLVSLKEIIGERRTIKTPEGKEAAEPVYFSSMEAMLKGAMAFVDFFAGIHKENKVYCGNSPKDFLFDLATGDMEYTGNTQIRKVEPEKFGVEADDETSLALSEFLAPELVLAMEEEEKLIFTMETDRYFVSVFLFEYFYHTGSPFEGKMMVNRCFLSPYEKEKFRAENGRFCMDVGEEENAPVKGIQDKLIRYWREYPDILGKMFQRAFLSGGLLLELRPTDVDWKQVLVELFMNYKSCGCGFHGYAGKLEKNENGAYQCPKCKKIYYPLSNGLHRILLAREEQLYECRTGKDSFDVNTVTGVIVENKKQKGLYGIKNVSQGIWRGLYPDGKTKEIRNGQVIPIWNGMQIRFEVGEEWTLRLINKTEERKEIEYEQ